MRKKLIKLITGTFLLGASVLVYKAAVTQTSGSPKKEPTKRQTAVADSTDIGIPTNDDPWVELDRLVKAYYLKGGVFYKGDMRLIDGNTEKEKVLEEREFEYTFFNGEYSYKLLPMEVIDKPRYSVIVNHDDKLIAVTPKLKSKKANKDLLSLGDFKKIIEQQKANVKITQLGDQKILTIDSIQDPTIQGYRIYYSPVNYQLSKMLIGMVRLSNLDTDITKESNEDGANADNKDINVYTYYLEINFSVIKQLSLTNESFTPENKFVKIDKNKIALTPEFKDYELFNSVKQ